MYFVSDGVCEAQRHDHEFFGGERFLELLERHRARPLQASLEAVVAAVREWCGESGAGDDVTAMALEITD